jgi:hypothetical protein
MDVLDEGLLDFWRALNKHGVTYIMVGGFAVNMSGFIRATKDADIWIEDTLENRKKFRKAFAGAGYGDFEVIETMDFFPGRTQFYIADGIALGIMTSMEGLEDLSFAQCFQMARIVDLNGIQVPFLHINHLLANKKALGRPKDLPDVLELEQIKKYMDENPDK